MGNATKNNSLQPAPINKDLSDNHNDFETYVSLANTSIEKDNWDEAYGYLKNAIEINPDYAQGYNHIGIFYTRKKKYTEAIYNFKKALQVDFSLGEAHYNLAVLYMERKEYDMALPHFKEVVLANPNDHETYYLMGVCCVNTSMEKEAESFFSESHRLKPEYIPPAISLCKLLIKNNDYTKAKNILLYIQMTDSSIPEINFLLGIIYKIQKKYMRAMHYLRETLLKDKNNAEAYNLLGECCLKSGMDKQAETFFSMAVKLDNLYLDAFYNLGDLYYKQGNYDDAIFSLEEFVKNKEAADSINSLWSETVHMNNTEIVPIYNLLGHCYKQIKNPVKARAVWEKSLTLQPEQQDIKDFLSDLPQPLHKRISLVID
ncbi:MAG: tetratricopeptide repeat protein [Candidatus Brocadia sp.]|nr:tetratricopeptide repeat protein [Candidatus Brocadia sp.]